VVDPIRANPKKSRVLVVDDEPGIRKTLRAYLEDEGYEVTVLADGAQVLPAVRSFSPDVVILDVMLPGMDGIEVLRQIRQESAVFVLMLSARGEESDRIVGLRMGADDYVTKPFSPREVVARVSALLRRSRSAADVPSETIQFSRMTIDPAARQVWKDGVLLDLTPIEFDILQALAQSHGRVLSRDQLIERAWGQNYFVEERVVDVHVRRLRRKIEDDPANSRIVVTVRSAGYRFEADQA
jgi:DNA-binding response OmpR family regulator